jgi:carbamoyl-phosphate synthase large subunit
MDELGVKGKLLATDVSPAAAAVQEADGSVIVPHVGNVEYLPALTEIVRKHKIRLIVPLTDLDLRSLARKRDDFLAMDCEVMIGTDEAITLCRDKIQFSRFLQAQSLPSIRTLPLNAFWKNPFFPCFVKPVKGSAGKGTAVIEDEADLNAHVEMFGKKLLVQDYIPGQEFTVDVYQSQDGQVRCVVPRQRLLVRGGEVDQGITVKDPQIIDATVDLARHIDGLWGVYCCQCRRPKGKEPHFFEVNPRFGGGSPLSIAAGANLPLYLLQEVTGKPLTAEMNAFTDQLLMLRYSEEFFLPFDNPRDLPGYDSPIMQK